MSKKELINTIGKIFVDAQFRNEFNNKLDSTVASIDGLDQSEREFLKNMAIKIRECTDALDVRYDGENKSR